MPYSESIADRIRECLRGCDPVEELRMMGGLCFMYREKMLAGVVHDELMLRVDPAVAADLVELPGCRPMTMGGKTMNGYLLIEEPALSNPTIFREWMQHALNFNPKAKSSRRRNA